MFRFQCLSYGYVFCFEENDKKDFVKDGQKLPLYGIGLRLVFIMAAVTLTGIVLLLHFKDWRFEYSLKTDGIYAWVKNPMYSGWWMLITGISLMWHNVWLLASPLINWGIMTVVLKNTEEKWLLDLYGNEYAEYKKRVNRCIPWQRR